MNVLAKIAWRNVWRNPRRSWVLMLAIAVGVFCSFGAISFMDGFAVEMIESAIDLQGGHIQVSPRGYHANPTIRSRLSDYDNIERIIAGFEGASFSSSVTTPGMANSTEQSSGVQINGIDPDNERGVSLIAEFVVEGAYLSNRDATGEILVGRGLAERLKLGLGDKMVLMVSDLSNEVAAGAYRIVGLFRTASTEFDKRNVYLPLQEAQRLVGYGDEASVITIRLASESHLDAVLTRLAAELGGEDVEILSWRDRNPMLVLATRAYDYASLLMVFVLFVAVAFTIINTFLMVIFERMREVGIMMANGVTPAQVRLMLYLEAVFMVLIGCTVGGAATSAFIWYLKKTGLNLSAFSDGLGSLGIGTVIYPEVNWFHLGAGFGMVVVMSLLAVIYPAIRASRYEVVDAINYV